LALADGVFVCIFCRPNREESRELFLANPAHMGRGFLVLTPTALVGRVRQALNERSWLFEVGVAGEAVLIEAEELAAFLKR